jgi:beta-galactosidase
MKRHQVIFAALAIAALLIACVASFAYQQKFVLRVNAGDPKPYTDKAGNVWQPDKTYGKGAKYGFDEGDIVDRGADVKIAGTNDPRIYQTEHYSMMKFTAEVPNGKYTVRMHFCETYDNIDVDGPRVFNVKIEGKDVLKKFEVIKAAGGMHKVLIREFKGVEVADGKLDILFDADTQNPEINGIEIIAE